ncbi:hypothetical protein HK405_009411 [Cladochytrium tenue]|nr:hypothetical protein HK405_009411 [Cladochytrium tenue]
MLAATLFSLAASAAAVAAAPAIRRDASSCFPSASAFIPTDSTGVPILFSWSDAKHYCSGFSPPGRLADDSSDANAGLGDLISACGVPGNRAWVGSWNGDDYQGTPIFLMQTFDGTDYAVYADVTNSSTMAAICHGDPQ